MLNIVNYERLVDHLETMLRENKPFDYREGYDLGAPGCVDCQCRLLMGYTPETPGAFVFGAFGFQIRNFLEVTKEEALALWRPSVDGNDPIVGDGKLHQEHEGAPGIQEALRRLKMVAARYGYVRKEFVPNDAEFLASVRALATKPLVEVI